MVRHMGIGGRFWKLLSRGEADAVDPDELVELVTVPQFQAPMTLAELEANGVQASVEDAFDLPTRTLSASRIMVRRADFAAAQEALVEGGAAPPGSA